MIILHFIIFFCWNRRHLHLNEWKNRHHRTNSYYLNENCYRKNNLKKNDYCCKNE